MEYDYETEYDFKLTFNDATGSFESTIELPSMSPKEFIPEDEWDSLGEDEQEIAFRECLWDWIDNNLELTELE